MGNTKHWLERKGWQVNADGLWYKQLGNKPPQPMAEAAAIKAQCEYEFYEAMRVPAEMMGRANSNER